jgi:hypothetical protein
MFGIVSLVDWGSKLGFLDAAKGGRHLARNRKAANLEVHATGADSCSLCQTSPNAKPSAKRQTSQTTT